MNKWYADIVRDFDGSYYCTLVINGKMVLGLPAYVDYRTLRNAIKDRTGIEIIKAKDLLFKRMGRKQEAIIDATRQRKDCRVGLDEMGAWKPCF